MLQENIYRTQHQQNGTAVQVNNNGCNLLDWV